MVGSLDTVDDVISQGPPPAFGREMLKYFMFDPEYTNLNHGSYGSLPRPVLASCNELTATIESNPDIWTRTLYDPRLVEVRETIALLVGVPVNDLVIVQNATTAINTVLRNIEWHHEDIILVCSTTYNSIDRVSQYLHDIPPHPRLEKFDLRLPCSNAAIVEAYEKRVKALREEVGKGPRILAVIDSIISNPGIWLPWKRMVKVCRENEVMSLVDGAHSIGQELNLELNEAGPDFFTSNAHKWLFAKRSAAFLYVPQRNQHLIKSPIPTPFSYLSPSERSQHPEAFVEMFSCMFSDNGTIDVVPYLSIIPAIKFRDWLGGEAAINAYTHRLAIQGGQRLANLLGTELLDPTGEQTLSMVCSFIVLLELLSFLVLLELLSIKLMVNFSKANVGVPFPSSIPNSPRLDKLFKSKLLDQRKIYAPTFVHNGRWWCRVSVQVWVELSDFDELAVAIREVCDEIREELKGEEHVRSKL
ncbi:pyridoxal phosphate-dependent transferase [Flagelloscypha sp. PMI_526]|nr:pyridoxal phosphate-dependent transferase [Flagelloscypha sp. PMI_526]